MQFHRTRSWLIALAILVAGTSAARSDDSAGGRAEDSAGGMGGGSRETDLQPFHPIDLGSIADFQLFAPPEEQSQDNYFKGNYGPFFRYERFYYSIHQPGTTTIGSSDAAALGTSENTTGFIKANFVWGNRFELGYVEDDNYGWDTVIIKSNNQFNSLKSNQPTNVAFTNERIIAGVSIPTLFAPLEADNLTRFVGVDLLKTFRYEPGHNGGLWNIGLGAKFFQLHDRFTVSGTTVQQTQIATTPVPGFPITSTSLTGTTTTTAIDTTTTTVDSAPNFVSTGVDNNMVGPEIKLQWEDKKGRWTFGSEFRFAPTANFQTIKQQGATGSGFSSTTIRTTTTVNTTNLSPPTITTLVQNQLINQVSSVVPAGQATNSFSHSLNQVSFAPMGELRLDTAFQLTKAASIRVGYTGMLMSGISRASQRVDYTLPDMGILPGPKNQHTYINGVNVGFDINY